jgi:hypothetical protein
VDPPSRFQIVLSDTVVGVHCLWMEVWIQPHRERDWRGMSNIFYYHIYVKLLPLPQPLLRARTDARTNPRAQRATQLRSVLARMYAVSRQNQITTPVPELK